MKRLTSRGLFAKVATLIRSGPSAEPRRKRAFATRLRLEQLEDRLVPSTFTVNTLADTVDSDPAVTSLREAITAANSQAGDDTINFSVTGTIDPPDAQVRAVDDETEAGEEPQWPAQRPAEEIKQQGGQRR